MQYEIINYSEKELLIILRMELIPLIEDRLAVKVNDEMDNK